MYLHTPKKYSNKRRGRLFSFRRLLLWILAPLGIFGAYWLYDNQETVRPIVEEQLSNTLDRSGSMIATITAPTPMPTENPVNLINRADMSWVSGRVEEAIAEYEQVLPNVPNDVTSHYNLTLGHIVEGRYDEALELAGRTVTADPFSSDAWAIRALALTRNGDAPLALGSGLHALQLDPENPRAHAYLTEVYLDLGLFSRAVESAERAVELDPDSAEAYFARAQTFLGISNRFNREAARADYATAYSLAPYLSDAAVEMALVDIALSDWDSAIDTLNEVRDNNPDNPNVLYWLGYVYYIGLGDPAQAADELSRCVRVADSNQACHYQYGRVLIALEQYEDAATSLNRAVELTIRTDEPNSRFHYWAAEAQIYLGNCPAALNILRPGYDIAVAQENTELMSALQSSIRECSAFDNSFVEPTDVPLPDDAPPTQAPDV